MIRTTHIPEHTATLDAGITFAGANGFFQVYGRWSVQRGMLLRGEPFAFPGETGVRDWIRAAVGIPVGRRRSATKGGAR